MCELKSVVRILAVLGVIAACLSGCSGATHSGAESEAPRFSEARSQAAVDAVVNNLVARRSADRVRSIVFVGDRPDAMLPSISRATLPTASRPTEIIFLTSSDTTTIASIGRAVVQFSDGSTSSIYQLLWNGEGWVASPMGTAGPSQ